MNEFIRQDDNIILNVPYAEAYIPYELFNENEETASSIAVQYGDGFRIVGIFNMRIFDSDDQPRDSVKLRTFSYPNMITTYPSDSSISNIKLLPDMDPDRYLILKYQLGDIVMSAEEVQSTANCTKLLNMITKGKVPNTVPYASFVPNIWQKNFDVNNFDPRVPSVTLQMIWAEMCRDPSDITKPYRLKYSQGNASQTGYVTASMNSVAAATSVFSALSFERTKEKLASSLNMTRNGTEQRRSPVEEVLSM